DACLMSMVEVAYQCRRSVNVLVGSEETEPAAGWPYQRVLGQLTAHPETTPQAFGSSIVSEYVASYDAGAASEVVTQAALDLARVEDVAAALDLLSAALMAAMADLRVYAGIRRARKDAQSFNDRDYLDLLSLCTLFQKYCPSQPVYDAAQRLIALVSPGVEGSMVLSAGSLGREIQDSHGLSIYFPPEGRVSPFYETLEMSKTTRWHDFLEGFRNKA
ncbi:MAG: clostripain-related cysteine peptidase, partial [Chloroflexota bacterium]|nr:clostripain-related cysteine peptidase [Chloroflexota bacterium]